MIRHELLADRGILIITPEGALSEADFALLAQVVDPYIAAHGKLNGLMIEAESFPGWAEFGALVAHFRFVRDHQRHIAKVAAVTDSAFLAIVPRIAEHFVRAQVRRFALSERWRALEWLSDASE